jgi:hypothetical protein
LLLVPVIYALFVLDLKLVTWDLAPPQESLSVVVEAPLQPADASEHETPLC